MPLTDDERSEWEARFRTELEEEHAKRVEAQSEADRRRLSRKRTEEEEREAEVAKLRLQTREQFWKDNGYVKYIDSRGAELWLLPDEYERRMKARKRQKRNPVYEPLQAASTKQALLFLGVLALAVILGLALGSG